MRPSVGVRYLRRQQSALAAGRGAERPAEAFAVKGGVFERADYHLHRCRRHLILPLLVPTVRLVPSAVVCLSSNHLNLLVRTDPAGSLVRTPEVIEQNSGQKKRAARAALSGQPTLKLAAQS
jgi:hypothetical protein